MLPPFYLWLSSVSVLLGLSLWIGGFFLKTRASYLAYTAALIYMAFCTKTPEALPRYLSVLFPFFIVLALCAARWEWSYEPLLVLSITALTFCTILRATGYWIV